MIFEVVSILGTFEDADIARESVRSALEWPGTSVHDVVVYVSDEEGAPVEELGDRQLAEWAGMITPCQDDCCGAP